MIEHINAQSLISSLDEIRLLIQERNIDILCITETWLLPHTPDYYINIYDFNVFRCDNGRGAGACIYVRDTLKSNVLSLDITRPLALKMYGSLCSAANCLPLLSAVCTGILKR